LPRLPLAACLLLGTMPLAAASLPNFSPGGEVLKSGLQPGESLPGTFEPLNVTGEHAGKRHCLVCEHGLCPVVMVFAREASDPLFQLLVKLDAAADMYKKEQLGCFVVFLSDRPELEKQLVEAAKKHNLKHVTLSIDNPAGPEGYKVAPNAAVTVVLYTRHDVKANHAFAKGRLTGREIDSILADLPKILPHR